MKSINGVLIVKDLKGDLNNLNISLKHSFIRILLPIIHFNSSAFIPMESFESGGLEKERF